MPDFTSSSPSPLALPRAKLFIRKAGLSQDAFADAVGLDRVSVNRILNGKQNWDSLFLQRAVNALNATGVLSLQPADLLGREIGDLGTLFDEAQDMGGEELAQATRHLRVIKGRS